MAARPQELSLNDLLNQQLNCAESLLRILTDEKTALLANDIEGLQKLCETKSAAAQTLQDLSAQLNKLCGSAIAAQIESFIRKQNQPQALGAWQSLLKAAARCQQANLENGALLLERQVRVRSLLQLIHRDERPLYGRAGASTLATPRRALALA